jgi:hypothetical protein
MCEKYLINGHKLTSLTSPVVCAPRSKTMFSSRILKKMVEKNTKEQSQAFQVDFIMLLYFTKIILPLAKIN